ncbi:cyanase [Actinomycetospora endophytica]|uniref:Cyanate hydratase n=1 Tax=Actinomycetospora endophytica TaxID=2291215 RepID=A0ABS8PGZ3_9PSEU|nr:cyanase [Actinomycetospora endophytica]MCD2197534.1 cyanase [Actinomycetospora endophytica]
MTSRDDRLDVGREIVRAKEAKGLSWQQLADELGRSLVWTTSALLGQQPLTQDQAQQIGAVLGLDGDAIGALSLPPVRGEAATDPTEPVTYRFQEALQVYGTALHELVREEFGDGIMSAIDFELEFERVPDPKGDRVKLTWNGKFLPYRVW